LVVGGGRVVVFPRLKAEDLSLNVDAAAMPHVQGDIAFAPFRSSTFHEVFFEKVPYRAFTGRNIGAISEAARILKRAGRLVIETGRLAPLREVMTALSQAGFHYLRVTDKGYLRITGRLKRAEHRRR
jgi:hypothetical protein